MNPKDNKPNEPQKERMKPDCALIGQNGNIYNLLGIASRTLRQSGMQDEASEMYDRVTHSGSYYEALGIIGEYVNITDGSESESCDEDCDDEYDEDCGEGQGMSL